MGSQAWEESGEQATAHAVASMKAAGDQRKAPQSGFGQVEAVVGKVTGCEGMLKEGEASMRKV